MRRRRGWTDGFAVCATWSDPAAMTDLLLDSVVTRARKQAHKRHSTAYRWLREHHAELAPIFADKQPPWREIAAELTDGGVHGGRGKALTGRALAAIWARVGADIAAAEAKRQAAQHRRSQQPSRLPADWHPTPVQPTAPRTSPPLFAHVQDQAGKDRRADLPPEVRAMLEDLDRQMIESDNRERGLGRREG